MITRASLSAWYEEEAIFGPDTRRVARAEGYILPGSIEHVVFCALRLSPRPTMPRVAMPLSRGLSNFDGELQCVPMSMQAGIFIQCCADTPRAGTELANRANSAVATFDMIDRQKLPFVL